MTVEAPHAPQEWKVGVRVDKYEGNWTGDEIDAGLADDAFVGFVESEGNLLTYGGVSAIWQLLIAGGAVSNFSAPYIGVGDSTTAAATTQTDLQASTNKLRKAMDSTYPQHTDSTSSSAAQTITFRSTFANADAVWDWNEWAVFNASSSGRMLNRKLEYNAGSAPHGLGTKPNNQSWQLTVTITIT